MAGKKARGSRKSGKERTLKDSAKEAGGIAEFIGNMAQSLDVLRAWAQAQDGLNVASCTFVLKPAGEAGKKKPPPASGNRGVQKGRVPQVLRTGGPDGGTPDPATGQPDGGPWPLGPEKPDAGTPTAQGVGPRLWHKPIPFLVTGTPDPETVATWGLRLHDLGDGRIGCLAGVINHMGFDTALGDQVACFFGSEEVQPDRRMLTFDGWVNPVGSGFGRFAGSVLVSLVEGKVVVEPGGCVHRTPNALKESGWEAGAYHVNMEGSGPDPAGKKQGP